jgi:hypothetical protein
VLFFLMARFADRGVSPAVLGGACVGALILIFVIVRFGRPASPPSAANKSAANEIAPAASRRARNYPRTLAVLAAVAFFEIAQFSTAGAPLKIGAGVAAAALLVWAVIYTRRNAMQRDTNDKTGVSPKN